jgi:hypothetical protein
MSTPSTRPTAEIKDSILDTVGETPLIRLSRIGAGIATPIVAKVEYFNPGGSIKDRVAGPAGRSSSPPRATPEPASPSPPGSRATA